MNQLIYVSKYRKYHNKTNKMAQEMMKNTSDFSQQKLSS